MSTVPTCNRWLNRCDRAADNPFTFTLVAKLLVSTDYTLPWLTNWS